MSPLAPPVGAEVDTVLVPEALVPIVTPPTVTPAKVPPVIATALAFCVDIVPNAVVFV